MSAVQKVFEEAKNKSREEKKALYASLISVEDKLQLYRLEKSKYFKDENFLAETTQNYASPSGKYTLTVTQYKTEPGSWNYSLGTVKINGQDIDSIQRNYHSFPYAWVENHS